MIAVQYNAIFYNNVLICGIGVEKFILLLSTIRVSVSGFSFCVYTNILLCFLLASTTGTMRLISGAEPERSIFYF